MNPVVSPGCSVWQLNASVPPGCEVGPVAGERLMGAIDVGDQRERPGRADDRLVDAVEGERCDVAVVQRDVEAGRRGVQPAAFQHVGGGVDALDIEPLLAGGNEEAPVAGAELERRATASLDDVPIPRVVGEHAPGREPGVVRERRDPVVPAVGQLLDELVARRHRTVDQTWRAAGTTSVR